MMIKFFQNTFVAIAIATMASPILAGGYLSVSSSGVARKWSTSTAVTVNYDIGPFSAIRTNAQGRALASQSLNAWTSSFIPTSALSFTTGTDLSEDHGDGLGTDPNWAEASPDGLTPIVFDQTGLITATLFAGAQNVIVGSAGPRWVVGNTITEGRVLLNGRFLDGAGSPTDIADTQFVGVISHEIGHLLNLDHAQCNDAFAANIAPSTADFTGYPTMYPIVHSNMTSLETEDIAWISETYPSGAYASRTAITGVTRDNAGNLINGVNVVARSTADARIAITCVSGYLDGSPTVLNGSANEGVYRIPNLPASSGWVIDFEQISPRFVSGSSVGPIDPPLVLNAPVEFINESAIETGSDTASRSTTFVTPNSGALTGVDVQLNSYGTTETDTESDGGVSFPSSAQSILPSPDRIYELSGSVNVTETGGLDLAGGDPIEDWYYIDPSAALGRELNSIQLVPASGALTARLYLVSFDQANSLVYTVASANTGVAGQTQEIVGWFNNRRFGSGTSANRAYIGVSATAGSGSYSLRIRSSIPDTDACVVSSISSTNIDRATGTFTILGRGFKNIGGTPAVAVSGTAMTINSVNFVSANQLNVNFTPDVGWVNGSATVQVTNPLGSASYAGRLPGVVTVPVNLSHISFE